MSRPTIRPVRSLAVLAAAGMVAVSCTGASAIPNPPSSPPARRPSSVAATTFPTKWPIKHVVFIIKENRSFDNLFGRFPGANGATMADDHGTMRPLTKGYDQRLPHDLPHDHAP